MEGKKLSFFKKVKLSILDFDGYQNLAAEKISRTIGYLVLIMLLFSVVISATYTFKGYQLVNRVKDYISTEIAEIQYENYELTIIPNSGEAVTEINVEDVFPFKIILNTQETDEEKIQESIDQLAKEENALLLLKDRLVLKSEISTKLLETSYKTISETYTINKLDKDETLAILSGPLVHQFMLLFFVTAIFYMFILYFSSILVDILLLFVLAYIVTRIAGLRLKYSAIYNIAAYSLTLPVLLNILYFVVNAFTGFTIRYFQIMYTAIASIYIITAILMIKSDVIKQQVELNRILEEQERVRQELKRQEEEKKEKEEQEKREKEREKQEKEKQKEEKKKKEEGNLGKQPEGDNA